MADRAPAAFRACGPLVLGLIGATTIAFAVQADEEAEPEDRARIAEALRAARYQSFEEVDLDDGVWEADDAVGSDGREYDLKLDRGTLEIIDKDDD